MRRTVLLGATAVLAVLVSGCGGNQTAASGSATSSQPPAASQPGAPSAEGASTTGGPCHASDLSATLGTKKEQQVNVQGQLGAAGTHYAITLTWTNYTNHTCTMEGFGGVDMIGPDLGSNGSPKYSLPRSGDTPHQITLKPQGTAHTVIEYIDPSGSQPTASPQWTPTQLEATPPNETKSIQLSWTAGTPVYQDPQDGAVAASISPVQSGS
jgi:hypothetical protein